MANPSTPRGRDGGDSQCAMRIGGFDPELSAGLAPTELVADNCPDAKSSPNASISFEPDEA
jgi:hypothetical protein